MAKPKSIKQVKLKAWEAFSLFIRLRDSSEYGMGNCCTCKQLLHYKRANAGHFIAGRRNSILFDEKCVHFQCVQCNIQGGNGAEYYPFMLETYGQGEIDRLRALKHTTLKLSYDDFDEIRQKYEALAEALYNALE